MAKKHLFFDYKSGSKIRFKATNCFENDNYPLIYRIRTEKLLFDVPRCMTLIGKQYVYIPLDYYRNVLTKYYLKINEDLFGGK